MSGSSQEIKYWVGQLCKKSQNCLENNLMTPLWGRTLLFRSTNSVVSESWRPFWADMAPFKGPVTRLVHCSRNYRETGTPSCQVCSCTRPKSTRIPSKTPIASLDCAFFKNAFLFIVQKIQKILAFSTPCTFKKKSIDGQILSFDSGLPWRYWCWVWGVGIGRWGFGGCRCFDNTGWLSGAPFWKGQVWSQTHFFHFFISINIEIKSSGTLCDADHTYWRCFHWAWEPLKVFGAESGGFWARRITRLLTVFWRGALGLIVLKLPPAKKRGKNP